MIIMRWNIDSLEYVSSFYFLSFPRSADAEPEAEADAEPTAAAEPGYGYYGHGYGHRAYGYVFGEVALLHLSVSPKIKLPTLFTF